MIIPTLQNVFMLAISLLKDPAEKEFVKSLFALSFKETRTVGYQIAGTDICFPSIYKGDMVFNESGYLRKTGVTPFYFKDELVMGINLEVTYCEQRNRPRIEYSLIYLLASGITDVYVRIPKEVFTKYLLPIKTDIEDGDEVVMEVTDRYANTKRVQSACLSFTSNNRRK